MPSSTREYLEQLAAGRGDAVVVTTMTAAKVWPALSDQVWDFNYLPSAMGHASGIALGLALAQPQRTVICVNGDASLLMSLGTLVTAAEAGACNLVMLLLDNGAYQIVGGGRVPGAGCTDYAALARACGWPAARRYETCAEFAAGLADLLRSPRPALAVLAVADPADQALTLPRRHPRQALRDLRARFRKAGSEA